MTNELKLSRLMTSDKWDVDEETGCWVWNKFTHKGYGKVGTRINGKPLQRPASRVALAMKLERDIPDGMLACHTCDNPPCVNPDHLYEGTPKENTRDMHERGRSGDAQRLGGLATRALSTWDALQIRALASIGVTYTELSSRFGVSKDTVNGIVLGREYKEIGGFDCRPDWVKEYNKSPKKLPILELQAVIREVKQGSTQAEVCRKYGIDNGSMSRIMSGKLYGAFTKGVL